MKRYFASAWLCVLLAAAQQAPEPGEIRASTSAYRPRTGYTVTVDTKLVEVGVVVRDSHGHTVPGLTKDDFEITDEGKKRPIGAFSVETSLPAASNAAPAATSQSSPSASADPPRVSERYVALLFDDVSMGPGELPRAQAAGHRFVKEDLRPGDRVAIFTISGAQNLPFTSDAAKLSAAIDQLHINNRNPAAGLCPSISPYDAYVISNHVDLSSANLKIAELARCQNKPVPAQITDWQGNTLGSGRSRAPVASSSAQLLTQVMAQSNSIWDLVRQTSEQTMEAIEDVVDQMAKMTGNRMILMASSGFISGSLENQMDEITRRALHAGVVINALDAKGLFTDEPILPTGGMDPRSITRLQLLGTMPKDLANDSLAELAYNTGGLFFHNNNDLTAGFHELGMRPETTYLLGFTPDAPDGKYHKLKVRVQKAAHESVQARLGYMAVAPSAAAPEATRRIDTVATGAGTLSELPGSLTSSPAQADNGDHGVTAVFHVDAARLHFASGFGTHEEQFALIAVLTDSAGAFVAGKEATVVLALKDGTYNRILPAGLNFTLTLPAQPGAYKLRAVMGEGVEGKISAETLPVEIR